MIPTPETISRLLEEQIRAAALAAAPPPKLSKRILIRLEAGWAWVLRDPVRTFLWGASALAFAAALTAYAIAWPPGGGTEQSDFAIAQGASLVFVTIVVGLVAGPVAASRAIDWDVAWVGRDPRTWLGFAALALISIVELLIGWSAPDPIEELATVFMTAGGLATAGLLARRLISLADPAVQLNRRVLQVTKALITELREHAAKSSQALAEAEVEPGIATAIVEVPTRAGQRKAADGLRRIFGTARGAVTRGEWRLAEAAYREALGFMYRYVLSAERIATDDEALSALRQESEDLHEMATGPAGRWLSVEVVRGFARFAADLIQLQRSTTQDTGFDSHGAVMVGTLENMIIRRLADDRSGDQWDGLNGIAAMADSEIEVGHLFGAAQLASKLCKFGALGVTTRRPDLSVPAWSNIVRILVRLAKVSDTHGAQMAFSSLGDDIVAAIRLLPALPPLEFVGFDAVVGHALGQPSLNTAMYELWSTSESRLRDVADFAASTGRELIRLLPATGPDHVRSARSTHVCEFIYHSVAAATKRTEDEITDEAKEIALHSIAAGLWQLRSLLLDEETMSLVRDHDTRAILHAYTSGWQMALYGTRGQTLSSPLREELQAFLDHITVLQVDDHLLPQARDGLRLLAQWLAREGHEDLADAVEETLADLPTPTPTGPFGLGSGLPLWGYFSDGYRLYRGSLIYGFFDRVEEHFTGDPGEAHANSAEE